MADEEQGTCPHCEAQAGPVGAPCPESLCARKGYRFIPKRWYRSAREYAARRQRPLDPLLGRLLDKYLLCGLLGEGGMGAVYLALQMPLRREVALKVISGLDLTEAAVARFEREARAISALDHPNIVKLYDYGVGELDFPVPYMVLEYVRHGRTLGEALARVREERGGVVPIPVILTVFRQILHALAAAHKVGIVHRDMKPENVMIAPVEGQPYLVKVLDFGLAKAVAEVTTQDGGLGSGGRVSRTGQILGTPYYMAPEQAPVRGRPHADRRSDLYAVGVMLFEVFTGVRAYDGQTPLEVLMKKGDTAYRPLDLPGARSLSPGLRAFLERAMAVDPAGRFASAEEMLQALEKVLSEPGAVARGPVPSGLSADRPLTPASHDSATRAYHDALGPSPFSEAPTLSPARWPRAEHPDGVSSPPEPHEDDTPVVPAVRPRRQVWVAVLGAAIGVGAALWLALGGEGGAPPATDVLGPSPEAVHAQAPALPDILLGTDRVEVLPEPKPVTRSFVIETTPTGALVEVEGLSLGAAPVVYEFTATGDDWRARAVRVRASGPNLVPVDTVVSLVRAVEEGRVAIRLEPVRKARKDRLSGPRRGLDGILGPDVEAGRDRTAPKLPDAPSAPEPPAPEPEPRQEPPPKKPAIPML